MFLAVLHPSMPLANDPLLHTLPKQAREAVSALFQDQEKKQRELAKENDRLARENAVLREALRLERIEKYGARSERLSDLQLSLLDTEPSVSAAEIEAEAEKTGKEDQRALEKNARRRVHPGREELPAHLERREKIIACAPEQCQCAQCGAEKKLIGYEQSEQLDCEPVQYFVVVTKREKRACAKCEEMGVSTAALPERIVEKSKLSDRVIVQVTIAKYADHLPLYRQAVQMEREAGFAISRGTLCGLIMQVGERLQPIARVLQEDLLAGGYIQADETPVPLQSSEAKGRHHRAWLWQYGRPDGPVVFEFQRGRGREGPAKFLGDFSGVLQNDGYTAYEQVGGPGLQRAACMAHARRYFVKAQEVAEGDRTALEILGEFGEIYAVEAQAREAGMNADQRLALRQEQSVPVLARLKEKILAARQKALPKHALGKACDYALKLWSRLTRFAEDGRIEVDNNWSENAIRPVALGRKNWMHIGSEDAGVRIAAIMSVIATCKRLKIPVKEYLEEVLPQVANWPASKVVELSPMAWAAKRATATAQ